MTTPNATGWYWHLHHNDLLEWCYGYQERLDYIQEHKPSQELALRLQLFQPVRGEVPAALDQAWRAFAQARQAYDQARQGRDEAWQSCSQAELARDEAMRESGQAWQTYEQSCRTFSLATKAVDQAWQEAQPEINALHSLECLNCPWDGETIFPTKKEAK